MSTKQVLISILDEVDTLFSSSTCYTRVFPFAGHLDFFDSFLHKLLPLTAEENGWSRNWCLCSFRELLPVLSAVLLCGRVDHIAIVDAIKLQFESISPVHVSFSSLSFLSKQSSNCSSTSLLFNLGMSNLTALLLVFKAAFGGLCDEF